MINSTLDDIATIVAAVSALAAAYLGNQNRQHIREVKDITNGQNDTVQAQNTQLTNALVAANIPVPETPAPSEPPAA